LSVVPFLYSVVLDWCWIHYFVVLFLPSPLQMSTLLPILVEHLRIIRVIDLWRIIEWLLWNFVLQILDFLFFINSLYFEML
jgi:hypothetical protein